jgi:GH15 family glucan-1,4-alpha-glucosidase
MAIHKYEMGVIGNCSFLGYVDLKADIKWLCMPKFDSSFIFGSLLDEEKGGHFYIIPAQESYESKQYYVPNTNVLCTEFASSEGRFRVFDFAPRMNEHERKFRPLMLIRKIELLNGDPSIKVVCEPRGNYGELEPEVVTGSNHISFLGIGKQVRITTDISLNYILEQRAFVLDQNKYIVLTHGEPLESPLIETAEDYLSKTIEYWQTWVKQCTLPGIYQEQIIRSALVLKIHQYEDTGGIIASGTTSLPEYHDSTRNWDYRYCWFRDSYYTLRAFNQVGHFDELENYFDFIQNVIRNSTESLQPLYSITGEKDLIEKELPLAGYKGNQPVRIGNKAYEQIQNDVYGQVLVSLLPLYIDKRLTFAKKNSYNKIVPWLLDHIERTMHTEDAGIWEFRNSTHIFTYTMLFHWAGAKAAYKIAESFKDDAIMEKADSLIKEAAANIEKTWDAERGCYTQAINSSDLDASTLKLITMNYLQHDDPKAKSHIKALEEELKTETGLFYRYKHFDDFGVPETTFMVCAFWYIDALACVGRVDDAINYLEKVKAFGNHLGIYSEDLALDGSQWGNFPQTYSHVGLINAAFRIARKIDAYDFV